MYLLYSLLLTLGFIVLLPRFAIDALRSGKYVKGLPQRLGNLPPINPNGKPLIWLHCVSVGETQAARSLVRALLTEFPAYSLVVSTTTITGQEVARKLFASEAAAVFYFPIDWAWTVRRVMRAVNPSVLLIMETELWPRLLHECRERAIPVALINGRISDNSFRRYQLIRPFIRRVLNDLTIALMQSEDDADRVRRLGLASDRIKLPGNLKFDSADTAVDESLTAALRERFGFDGRRPLLVAASTHAPEERMVVEAVKQLGKSPGPSPRLLIAPRHPERFAEVARILRESGLTWTRRASEPGSEDAKCDAVLLDTIGELRSAYPLAEIVFVGGSIAPHGGHNVLEPAAHGRCVVTGANMQNFAAITGEMVTDGALIQLPDLSPDDIPAHLAFVLRELLSDEPRRREIGRRAQQTCRRNAGAAQRTLRVLAAILSKPSTLDRSLPFSTLHVTAAK